MPFFFSALKPNFVLCVLSYSLGYNLQHCLLLHTRNLLCGQHDSRHCHLSSPQTVVYPLCIGTYFVLPDTTLSGAVRLSSPQTRVCPLRAEAWTALKPEFVPCMSGLFSLAGCFCGSLLVFLRRPHSFLLFWFYILDYISPKFKIHSMGFELLIFKLGILLTKVHTIIDNTFSDSTILGFDFRSNELIGMHLGSILRQSCRDLPNLGLGPPCYVKLF